MSKLIQFMIINGPQFSGAVLHSVNYSVMGWVGQNFPICKMKREAHLHFLNFWQFFLVLILNSLSLNFLLALSI